MSAEVVPLEEEKMPAHAVVNMQLISRTGNTIIEEINDASNPISQRYITRESRIKKSKDFAGSKKVQQPPPDEDIWKKGEDKFMSDIKKENEIPELPLEE